MAGIGMSWGALPKINSPLGNSISKKATAVNGADLTTNQLQRAIASTQKILIHFAAQADVEEKLTVVLDNQQVAIALRRFLKLANTKLFFSTTSTCISRLL